MAQADTRYDIIAPVEPQTLLPAVRQIGIADLRDALRQGLDDFWAMPSHVVFLGLLYPAVGLLLGRAAFGYDIVPLLYPLAAGFALVGPFAAIGLYELSRRRELGLDTSWRHAFDIIHSPSLWPIAALGLLLVAIFGIWLGIADAIYVANFGFHEPTSLTAFARRVLTTPEGHNLMIYGNAIGFVFAALAATLSVVSFPMLLDRHVGFAAAVITSVRAVLANPLVMAVWGLIVGAALLLGSLPLFFGLAVVVPVLGHATWHLYRKLVAPDTGPRPEIRPRPKAERHAADFPASLFPVSRPPRNPE